VLEYLNFVRGKLPKDVNPPWDRRHRVAGSLSTWWKTPPANMNLSNCAASRIGTCATSSNRFPEFRKWPVWRLRQAVQVVVDPNTLAPTASPVKVKDAIMRSNNDVGGGDRAG